MIHFVQGPLLEPGPHHTQRLAFLRIPNPLAQQLHRLDDGLRIPRAGEALGHVTVETILDVEHIGRHRPKCAQQCTATFAGLTCPVDMLRRIVTPILEKNERLAVLFCENAADFGLRGCTAVNSERQLLLLLFVDSMQSRFRRDKDWPGSV